jgi:Flp pilus assembly CpaF family ATPase
MTEPEKAENKEFVSFQDSILSDKELQRYIDQAPQIAATIRNQVEIDVPDVVNNRNEIIEAIVGALQRHDINPWAPGLNNETWRYNLLVQQVWASLSRFGVLFFFLTDPNVENIDIQGHDVMRVQYAGGSAVWVPYPRFGANDRQAITALTSLLSEPFTVSKDARIDFNKPSVDAELWLGARLSADIEVARKPVISIRKHLLSDITLDRLVGMGTLSDLLAKFLAAAVRARLNILVAGPMGSGKTTLLRALCAEIPPMENIATIEDTYELHLFGWRHPFCKEYQTREKGIGSEATEVTARDLARRALRKNLSRLIVGEVRGDEILAMLNAMTQGQSGSMCTIHAESARGAIDRIAQYCLQAPERLAPDAANYLAAQAVNLIVYIQPVYQMPESTELGANLGAGWQAEYDLVPKQSSGFLRVVTDVEEVAGYAYQQGKVQTNKIAEYRAEGNEPPRFRFYPERVTQATKQRVAVAGFDWSSLTKEVSL